MSYLSRCRSGALFILFLSVLCSSVYAATDFCVIQADQSTGSGMSCGRDTLFINKGQTTWRIKNSLDDVGTIHLTSLHINDNKLVLPSSCDTLDEGDDCEVTFDPSQFLDKQAGQATLVVDETNSIKFNYKTSAEASITLTKKPADETIIGGQPFKIEATNTSNNQSVRINFLNKDDELSIDKQQSTCGEDKQLGPGSSCVYVIDSPRSTRNTQQQLELVTQKSGRASLTVDISAPKLGVASVTYVDSVVDPGQIVVENQSDKGGIVFDKVTLNNDADAFVCESPLCDNKKKRTQNLQAPSNCTSSDELQPGEQCSIPFKVGGYIRLVFKQAKFRVKGDFKSESKMIPVNAVLPRLKIIGQATQVKDFGGTDDNPKQVPFLSFRKTKTDAFKVVNLGPYKGRLQGIGLSGSICIKPSDEDCGPLHIPLNNDETKSLDVTYDPNDPGKRTQSIRRMHLNSELFINRADMYLGIGGTDEGDDVPNWYDGKKTSYAFVWGVPKVDNLGKSSTDNNYSYIPLNQVNIIKGNFLHSDQDVITHTNKKLNDSELAFYFEKNKGTGCGNESAHGDTCIYKYVARLTPHHQLSISLDIDQSRHVDFAKIGIGPEDDADNFAGTLKNTATLKRGLVVGGDFKTSKVPSTSSSTAIFVAGAPFGGITKTSAMATLTATDSINALQQASDLFAAGHFKKISWRGPGKEVNHIARFTGYKWQPVGNGVSNTNDEGRPVINDMAFVQSSKNKRHPQIVYVGGDFDKASGQDSANLAYYNYSNYEKNEGSWHSISDTPSKPVNTLLIGPDMNNLWVGGDFGVRQLKLNKSNEPDSWATEDNNLKPIGDNDAPIINDLVYDSQDNQLVAAGNFKVCLFGTCQYGVARRDLDDDDSEWEFIAFSESGAPKLIPDGDDDQGVNTVMIYSQKLGADIKFIIGGKFYHNCDINNCTDDDKAYALAFVPKTHTWKQPFKDTIKSPVNVMKYTFNSSDDIINNYIGVKDKAYKITGEGNVQSFGEIKGGDVKALAFMDFAYARNPTITPFD